VNILRTGALTAIATAARLVSSFIVMKLVAVLGGPEGVAQFGQFMSIATLLVVFAGGGVGPGVVKYVAEMRSSPAAIQQLVRSALAFTIVFSVIMCVGILMFVDWIATNLLGDPQFRSLIVVLAFTQLFVALHNLIVAIVNGLMDIKRLTMIHVIGAVVGTLLPLALGYTHGLYGVLLAYILAQASMLVISFIVFGASADFTKAWLVPALNKQTLVQLSRFSVMTLTSALLAPLVQVWVRNILSERFSWEVVGYWQAVSKVSEAYLLFITMAISVYYLPRLSAVSDKKTFVLEITKGYTYLMPVVCLMAIAIYLMRDLVTRILFAEGFEGALPLYAPQLLGDVIKIASFMLSYIMLAKAMTRLFILSEVCFSLMYVGWVVLLTNYWGIAGAMYAFIANYVVYLAFTFFVAKFQIRSMS